MFLDAFVATLQCEALCGSNPEDALFICFHHYMKNKQTFMLEDALENYTYRNI